MGTLLICLLAVPSGAGERAAKSPSAMAARRAAAQPSAMAVRRGGSAPFRAAGSATTSPPSTPSAPPVVAAAAADPVFGPRITAPTGSPTGGLDLRKDRGVTYTPAAPTEPAALPAPIGAELAGAPPPERAAAGVKGAAVTELKAGRTDRQFGGASDPVLFLVGGTGPSGSVSSSSDGSNLSISLGSPR